MSTNLITFISNEILERGWSVRELARRAEIAPTTINDVLGKQTNPGPRFCNGIARALREPPERIFRLAGFLPPVVIGHKDAEIKQELDDTWRYLTTEERETLAALGKTFYEKREAYNVDKRKK